jgi:hypothetical protein
VTRGDAADVAGHRALAPDPQCPPALVALVDQVD